MLNLYTGAEGSCCRRLLAFAEPPMLRWGGTAALDSSAPFLPLLPALFDTHTCHDANSPDFLPKKIVNMVSETYHH